MKLHPNIKYRSDIDGLRAIAVLSVILFHINTKWIPGGFLGVDIFFVISGYLITLILTKEVDETHKINIANFYKRRIKRIFPALLFVLIPTFIVGYSLFSPSDMMALSKSIFWSVFSMANIYFFSSINTGYFATLSSELPLLHLWSLGVEEQFYILWPFAVLFLLKYVTSIKSRLIIVSSLFIGSLVWAQLIIVTSHSFAYYMLPTRAWELLSGAIVALLVHNGFRVKNIVNEIMAYVGLFIIILSFIFVSKFDPVPGIAALPIIIATSLLILSGISYQTYVGRILSFKVLVGIGLVSYSAYLWHWPILAFLRYALVEIDLNVSIIVIIPTFILATISYFFIERPLRINDISAKKIFLWYFAIPTTIIVIVVATTTLLIKYKKDFLYSTEFIQADINTLPAYTYEYNCQFGANFSGKEYHEDRCVYPNDTDTYDMLLIGDSNAAHYLGMFRVFSDHFSFNIRNTTVSECPLIFNGEYNWIKTTMRKGCSTYRHSVFEEAKKYNTVVVGGSWNGYYQKEGFNKNFEETIVKLSKSVKHIILLAKIPMFPGYKRKCEVLSMQLNSLNCSTRFNNQNKEDISNQFLREIAKKYNNVEYFDIRDKICHGNECSPYQYGHLLYFDSGHLSMKGSELLGKSMIQEKDSMLYIFNHLKD